LRKKLQLNKD